MPNFFYFFTLLLLLTFFSCRKKESTAQDNFTPVTYELETAVTGFSKFEYVGSDPSQFQVGIDSSFTVTAPGVYRKQINITKGTSAGFSVTHPSSNNWKIRIRNSAGTILQEAAPMLYTPPGGGNYYYATAQALVN